MIDFGYKINKDSQIDFDANNREMADYITKREPSFLLCINCGSCSGTCTTGLFTDFSVRRLFTLIKRGEVKGIKEQVDKCMLCGKCKIVCPRGVNTRNVILNINRALKTYEL